MFHCSQGYFRLQISEYSGWSLKGLRGAENVKVGGIARVLEKHFCSALYCLIHSLALKKIGRVI